MCGRDGTRKERDRESERGRVGWKGEKDGKRSREGNKQREGKAVTKEQARRRGKEGSAKPLRADKECEQRELTHRYQQIPTRKTNLSRCKKTPLIVVGDLSTHRPVDEALQLSRVIIR